MFKYVLITIVIVPVLLGMLAATSRRRPVGLLLLLIGVVIYNVCYLGLLYYLRIRWVG